MDGRSAADSAVVKVSGTNERDLRALAYLATRLRTETMGAGKWDDNGIWPILKKLEGQNLAVVIERVTRHAQDPEAKTPGAILRPFVPQAVVESRHPHPLRAGDPDECRIHAGQHRDHCSGCQADSLVGDSTPTPQRQRTGPTEAWKVARQELDLKHALEPKTETKEEAS